MNLLTTSNLVQHNLVLTNYISTKTHLTVKTFTWKFETQQNVADLDQDLLILINFCRSQLNIVDSN